MRIITLKSDGEKGGIILRVEVTEKEFSQLKGSISELCVFAVKTITEQVRAINTGARKHYAKWFLVPVKLRRKYKGNRYDFRKVKCNCIEYEDQVFFIYMVGRKMPREIGNDFWDEIE